jgi:serine/threonine protein kinase/Tfp pilus assembly protein PilF
MGVVYEAEQQHPRRPVALKVIRGGHYVDEHVVRLFEREAQALARLRHPGIAAIYEAGRTEEGQHFFAMELVRGTPLLDYVLRRQEAAEGSDQLRDRLRLFTKICEAVNYAHQRGVIHRDLKPSNILVSSGEGMRGSSGGLEGVPEIKILDFGLARITDADVAVSTIITEIGQIQGTLAYMSPEQTRGNPDEIDLRSDVYTLGVILFELLTGQLPYEVHKGIPHEGLRIICEEPPQLPSRLRFRTSGKEREKIDRDLDTIILKALEKEPWRRYQSAWALAEDVERYLSDQPILARPPSTIYQIRKLVARHKGVVGFAVTLALLVVGFGIAMAVQSARVARERDKAVTAERESHQVSTFLVDLFKISDPSEARGNTVTARQILDRGAERISGELREQPVVQARLMDTIGQVYRSLGLFQQAKLLLERALETRRSLLGEDHLEVSDSFSNLANVLWDRGDYSQAKQYFERSLSIKEKALGPNDIKVATVCHNLASVLWSKGDYATAKPLLERALAIREKVLGPRHPEVSNTMNSLGALYYTMGDYVKAQSYWERTLAIREEVLGSDHPKMAMTLNNLGTLKKDRGDYVGAKPLLERAIRIQEKSLGPNHPNLAAGLNNLSDLLRTVKDYDAAKPLIQRAITIEESNFGPDHPEVARFLGNFAEILRETGDYAGARPVYERALTIREKTLGENHRDTAWSLQGIAHLDADEGRYADAERHYLKALQVQKRALGPDQADVGWSLCGLADLYSKQGRNAEAEVLYTQALVNLEKNLGPDHPNVKKTQESLTSARKKLSALPAKSTK